MARQDRTGMRSANGALGKVRIWWRRMGSGEIDARIQHALRTPRTAKCPSGNGGLQPGRERQGSHPSPDRGRSGPIGAGATKRTGHHAQPLMHQRVVCFHLAVTRSVRRLRVCNPPERRRCHRSGWRDRAGRMRRMLPVALQRWGQMDDDYGERYRWARRGQRHGTPRGGWPAPARRAGHVGCAARVWSLQDCLRLTAGRDIKRDTYRNPNADTRMTSRLHLSRR
jgi:hypothetical protein